MFSNNHSYVDAFDEVAIVTVTYKSAHLASFFAETAKAFRHVYVIDNASGDSTVAAFAKSVPHAQVLAQNTNLGFGSANNIGFRAAYRNGKKFVLFLNPDCKIEPDHASRMLSSLINSPSAGILCCSMLNEKGEPYPLFQCDYNTPFESRQVATVDSSTLLDPLLHNACIEGACFLVRSEIFDEIGQFSEDLFMYSEEDDVAMRLTRLGYEVVVDTNAQATHLGGVSSPNSLRLELRKAYHARWSRFWMSERYIGKGHRLKKSIMLTFLAPIPTLIYALLLNKKKAVKWMGWWAAAIDGIRLTKFFRHIL